MCLLDKLDNIYTEDSLCSYMGAIPKQLYAIGIWQ